MERKLRLSMYDRKLVGVCGGIAEYLNVDSTVVRLVFALLTVLGGCGIIAYLICWAIIPRQ